MPKPLTVSLLCEKKPYFYYYHCHYPMTHSHSNKGKYRRRFGLVHSPCNQPGENTIDNTGLRACGETKIIKK